MTHNTKHTINTLIFVVYKWAGLMCLKTVQ